MFPKAFIHRSDSLKIHIQACSVCLCVRTDTKEWDSEVVVSRGAISRSLVRSICTRLYITLGRRVIARRRPCRQRRCRRRRRRTAGMLGASRLEVCLAHRPAGAARARHVYLSLAAARQTSHDRPVLVAMCAPVTGCRPHGSLQADDAGAHDVHARRPHSAVAVHPHLAGVRTGARHASEQRAPDGGQFARVGGVHGWVCGVHEWVCRGR